MEAQVALSGNVGNDIEYISGEGWQFARFRLGCTPRYRKGNEWVNAETTWISVRASGNTACNVRDSLRKGDPVVVVGRLRTRVWQDEAGTRHERLQVEAASLGHDLSRGVSTFVRPERLVAPFAEDEPLGPDDSPEALEPAEDDDVETELSLGGQN